MINWGITAPCNLIPANWDFSHISPEQNAIPNEGSCFHSLICGQQQEPGPADLFGDFGLLSSRPDPTGVKRTGVRSQSQQPWTSLWISTVPSNHKPSTALTLLRPGWASCADTIPPSLPSLFHPL
ncbi:hypothetical protein ABVT39_008799 [Epinephelus coioides]